MRATTVLKASDLVTAVTHENQFAPPWRSEHFANGRHNSPLIPITVIEVSGAGAVVVQQSVTFAGASFTATASRLALGRYLVTLDTGVVVAAAEAMTINTASSKAEVDLIANNTVQVRAYTVNSSGTFAAADMNFSLYIYASRFPDAAPADLTTAFVPGDYPDVDRVKAIIDAQNAIWDLAMTNHAVTGVHTEHRAPFALGRITYSGGVYSIATGSSGINAVSRPGTGKCAIEFNATAPNHWLVRTTPIGVAAYIYNSAYSTTGSTVEIFSTATKPTYALGDMAFFVAGWAL